MGDTREAERDAFWTRVLDAVYQMRSQVKTERALADDLFTVLISTWEADDPHYYDKYVQEVERVKARYREARR